MGNKPPITLPEGQWIDLDEVLEGGLVQDKTYLLQATDFMTIYVGDTAPEDISTGFRVRPEEKTAYTHANQKLFLNARYSKVILNVAD